MTFFLNWDTLYLLIEIVIVERERDRELRTDNMISVQGQLKEFELES